LPKSIWETYASFANTFGGTIVLGVGEDASSKRFIPLGISEPDKMINDIWNSLNNKTKVSTNILLQRQACKIDFEGKTFVIIEVPRANKKDKPVYLNGDIFNNALERSGTSQKGFWIVKYQVAKVWLKLSFVN
jgi:ATP-dependent DNA helicase RecG